MGQFGWFVRWLVGKIKCVCDIGSGCFNESDKNNMMKFFLSFFACTW